MDRERKASFLVDVENVAKVSAKRDMSLMDKMPEDALESMCSDLASQILSGNCGEEFFTKAPRLRAVFFRLAAVRVCELVAMRLRNELAEPEPSPLDRRKH